MSASEIVEEIRELPEPEQERVLEFLQSVRSQRKPAEVETRYATDTEFDEAADKVSRDHADLFRRLAQ